MCLCFETIKIENGYAKHLIYHQKRFDKTRRELYGCVDRIHLSDYIKVSDNKTYRLKIIYAQKIEEIQMQEYQDNREFENFSFVDLDFEYSYKFFDRKNIDNYAHDVIFLKEGYLSDTKIANIAIMLNDTWLTPKYPMLEGTTRARLIQSGFLKEENLDTNSLKIAQKFAIMNSLIGFKVLENIRIND
jgi:4-amino-4-deoxychorismate lyase